MDSKLAESKPEEPSVEAAENKESVNKEQKEEEKLKNEFQNACLIKLQKEEERLRNEFQNREKLIKELLRQKEQKELRLQNLQTTIENKSKEVEAEKRRKNQELQIESDWQEKLKVAKKRKFASALEYSKRMTELRTEVFTPENLDDVKVNEEIEKLLNSYESMCQKNKLLQLNIDNAEKKFNSENEVNDIIDGINSLIKQLKLETANDGRKNQKMLNDVMRMEAKIEQITKEK